MLNSRSLRLILSNANLAGSASALVVVGLYLVNVIDQYWWALALLAYGTAALAVGSPKAEHLPEGLTTAQALAWVKDKALPRLTGEAQAVLARIVSTAEELLPRLKELEAAGAVQAENRTRLKQTLVRYLPDVLETYFKLPLAYARTAKTANGKTPQLLLTEQLKLLEEHVMEIREGVFSPDLDQLLVNGRFLEEVFAKGIRFDKT